MKNVITAFKRQGSKAAVLASLATASAMASAAGIEEIGTSAATEIAKFSIMISAIGAAVLTVVVLIQGFRMAFKMIRASS